MAKVRSALREYRSWTADSRRWDHYHPRAGDIVIATYPKCGTTWMQQIVGLLVFASPEPRPIGVLSPWLDMRPLVPVETVIEQLDAQSHRRFIKCHVPFDGMPVFDEVRYIHVARDGRDACLSFHNHCLGLGQQMLAATDRVGQTDPTLAAPFPRAPADFTDFYRRWMSRGIAGAGDGLPFFSWFDFERTYWQERQRENLLLVHYRDLKTDLAGEMRRIAAFLGIEIRDAVWPSLVHAATFTEMKKVGEILHPHVARLFEGGAGRFFNKGENDRWHGMLDTADLALFDDACRRRLSPASAEWLAQGRLAGRDPATATD